MHGTTILCVRKDNQVVRTYIRSLDVCTNSFAINIRTLKHLLITRFVQCIIGDGQVSLGSTVIKPNAKKVRRIGDSIVAGFAGSTADAYTLMERLEGKLDEYPDQLTRACVELAKEWRTDKFLRRLEVRRSIVVVQQAACSFDSIQFLQN